MENLEEPLQGTNSEEQPSSTEETPVYPPKYQRESRNPNVWIRSLVSLALYLLIGYYIFPSYKILLLITAIVLIHEMGHFIAMKLSGYNDLGIFFIPLLGAYVSGTKREVSQRQSAIILLAGPLPGIILGIIFYLLWEQNHTLDIAGISYYTISFFFVILNLFNLLPVYPLDGGQLLNRVFFNEENWLSRLFILLSIGLMIWFAINMYSSSGNRVYLILLLLPLMMLVRMLGEKKLATIEKRIEAEGINTDLEYNELPDKDYWKIRNILIAEHPVFRDVMPAPPYEYCPKEDRIMTFIQSLLHRHLLQDLSLIGKLLILFIWIAAIVSPWLVDMDMSFFRRLGL